MTSTIPVLTSIKRTSAKRPTTTLTASPVSSTASTVRNSSNSRTGSILGNDTCISSNIGCDTTGMECTQCQLCTRLTDRLCSDYTDSLTFLNHTAGSQVTSITFGTNPFLGFASQYRTDFNAFDWRLLIFSVAISSVISSPPATISSPVVRMNNIMYGYTTKDTFRQSSNDFIVVLQVLYKPIRGACRSLLH